MKSTYTEPRAASWTFVIYPYDDANLVEEAPLDPETRAMFRLVEPVRKFLEENRHTMVIDRGDFGEGDEHFHITFGNNYQANEFRVLCKRLEIDGKKMG